MNGAWLRTYNCEVAPSNERSRQDDPFGTTQDHGNDGKICQGKSDHHGALAAHPVG